MVMTNGFEGKRTARLTLAVLTVGVVCVSLFPGWYG